AVDGAPAGDQIHVLAVMARNRAVTPAVEQQCGWTPAQSQVVDSTATVTVSAGGVSKIVRRTPNVQWAALGGQTVFQSEPFLYQCGPDSFAGPNDASRSPVPMTVVIEDGDNLNIQLTMTSPFAGENGLFLQGEKGLTPAPKLGVYYSWPQLAVTGTVVVEEATYPVSGTGWIDHQLMMYAPPAEAARPAAPTAGWAPMQAFDGWSWCQFNLANGDAFTGAAFQTGGLKTDAFFEYGLYVSRTPTGFATTPLVGSLALDRFVPGLENVLLPTAWRYDVTDWGGGLAFDLTVAPGPVYPDGSFATGNLKVEGETPVTVTLLDRGPNNRQEGPCTVTTGQGYCESVSYEPPQQYVQRGLAFLGVGPGT
ncbi:MAG TPA: lipocalin-like domain-containing protein, partial [Caulobacter sp.]|nr:lipocalin-like domain-containing protein [Caulobacter sp.]